MDGWNYNSFNTRCWSKTGISSSFSIFTPHLFTIFHTRLGLKRHWLRTDLKQDLKLLSGWKYTLPAFLYNVKTCQVCTLEYLQQWQAFCNNLLTAWLLQHHKLNCEFWKDFIEFASLCVPVCTCVYLWETERLGWSTLRWPNIKS